MHTLFLVAKGESFRPASESSSIGYYLGWSATETPEGTDLGVMEVLPTEVILYLYSFLDCAALGILAQVNSTLR